MYPYSVYIQCKSSDSKDALSTAELWEKAVVALFLWERLNVSVGVFVFVKTHQTCSLSSWFAVGWRALGPGCVADSAHTGRSRECAAGRSPCSLCAATH